MSGSISISSLKSSLDKLNSLRKADIFNDRRADLFSSPEESASISTMIQSDTKPAADVLQAVIDFMEEYCTLDRLIEKSE